MALQGYLAGIYRSVGRTVGAAVKQNLLDDPGFESGTLTSWSATGTVIAQSGGSRGGSGFIAKGTDAGTGASLSQTVTLASALASNVDCVAKVWAKMQTGKSALLTVVFKDDVDDTIATKTMTITSTPSYSENGWGLWSMRITAPKDTKKIVYTFSSDASQTWYIDDCGLMLLQQILGATGELSASITVQTQDITTFASAAANSGFRSHYPVLRSGETITVRTFWSTDDTYKITEQEPVYVMLYVNTTTHERWEFWAYISGITQRFPLEGVREGDLTLTVEGDVGFTSAVAN